MAHEISDSLDMTTRLTLLGRDPLSCGGSVNAPIHRTSTLIFNDFEEFEAYEQGKPVSNAGYGRMGTETTRMLEESLAHIEGAHKGWVLASGCSAIAVCLLAFVGSGDHMLIADTVYGPTRKFCDHELSRMGVEISYYDPEIGDGIASLIKDNTKVIYLESPGSLTFEVQDVRSICDIAHQHDCIVIGDNTWGTPLHYKPYDLGIDVSIQSATKYIAGHSDLLMGYVSCTEALVPALDRTVKNIGACPSGDNCFLAMRGLRTMAVRMEAQMKASLDIAGWIKERPEVSEVLYPALPGAPGHELWKRDFTGAASLFGVVFENHSRYQIAAFVNALKLFGIGLSWGGYESLVIAYKPAHIRTATKSKWNDDTYIVRLHIGLEAIEDLRSDLAGAFDAMKLAQAA